MPSLTSLTQIGGNCEGCELGELLARIEIIVRGDEEKLLAIHHRSEGEAFDVVDVEPEIAFVDLEPRGFRYGAHIRRLDLLLAEDVFRAGQVGNEKADMVADAGSEIALYSDESTIRHGGDGGETIVVVFRLGGCRGLGDRLGDIDMFGDRLQCRRVDDENTGRAAGLRGRLLPVLGQRVLRGGDQPVG